MAVKIIRQPNQIALLGAPTSAGSHSAGTEQAPAALRAAGLVEKLQAAGYRVNDLGDCALRLWQPDDENPRARNTRDVLAALNDLRPCVELAVKSGAIVLVLGGDCTITLATLAGIRRYFNKLSLLYLDRDADLQTPATTPSGCLHGMAVAHITGRGAPELVRFWNDPPLVREPDVALFGLDRVDPAEEMFLASSAMQRYTAANVSRHGVVATAQTALDRVHAGDRQLVVHFDVDVIAAEDFSATGVPGSGGLRMNEVRAAFEVFAGGKNLAAIEITEFDPTKDADGSAAKAIVEIVVAGLAARLAAQKEAAATAAASAGVGVNAASVPVTPSTAPRTAPPLPVEEPVPSLDTVFQESTAEVTTEPASSPLESADTPPSASADAPEAPDAESATEDDSSDSDDEPAA